MDYSALLKRAWELVWNNKFMFGLGFLAALASGSGGSSGGNFNTGAPVGDSTDFDVTPEIFQNLEQYWAEFAILTIAVVIFLIILSLVFWLFSLVGKAGMIDAAVRLDAGEQMTFGQAFSAGTQKLGSMAGLSLLLYLPTIIILTLLLISIGFTVGGIIAAEVAGSGGDFSGAAAGLGVTTLICFGLLACLLVPYGIFVTVVHPFAQRGLVLRDMGIVESIRHGWNVVKENIGDVLVLAVIFAVVGVGFGILTAVIIVPVALIVFLPTILAVINGGAFGILNVVMIILGVIAIGLLSAAVQSVMLAFRSTAVTLAYQQFMPASSKKELLI
ncbi:MAG: hypothetical protein AAF490_19235 [Chloroflexota bacterium]